MFDFISNHSVEIAYSAGLLVAVVFYLQQLTNHLRTDITKIYERLDNIDKKIATIEEWNRMTEKQMNAK